MNDRRRTPVASEEYQQQSVVNVAEKLVKFLDELLLCLSSMITPGDFRSTPSLPNLSSVAERLYQLRGILLSQINGAREQGIDLVASEVTSILHELVSLTQCLRADRPSARPSTDWRESTPFQQLLDRLEGILQSSMACFSEGSHPQVG